MLTKAKGWAKIAAPGAAWGTIRGATDAKKKSKKK